MASRVRPPKVFSHEEIRITATYENQIGSGANAIVYRGVLEHRTVAVKVYNSRHQLGQFQNEKNMYHNFNHPNILKMIGVGEAQRALVLEYAPSMLGNEIAGNFPPTIAIQYLNK
ncbi:hypothetical protein Salat_0416200 [Sesamum alatum]|uniref:RING-type E3 ubiquitin transferase n=1 Tax=Sesamum alatum TaxID=300844 RepID=A0AAE1Z3H0_9LAMI|nr:hypothetical protein Salat_0416200 [Sesamum alatum]